MQPPRIQRSGMYRASGLLLFCLAQALGSAHRGSIIFAARAAGWLRKGVHHARPHSRRAAGTARPHRPHHRGPSCPVYTQRTRVYTLRPPSPLLTHSPLPPGQLGRKLPHRGRGRRKKKRGRGAPGILPDTAGRRLTRRMRAGSLHARLCPSGTTTRPGGRGAHQAAAAYPRWCGRCFVSNQRGTWFVAWRTANV